MSEIPTAPPHHHLARCMSAPDLQSVPFLSDFMTDMYMDIIIKEYNNPEPSIPKDQKYNTGPNTVASPDPELNTYPDALLASKDREFNISPSTVRPYFQEHNDPQPGASQDREFNNSHKASFYDVKKLQAEIDLLEEMKKAHTEKGLSTTVHTAVDADPGVAQTHRSGGGNF